MIRLGCTVRRCSRCRILPKATFCLKGTRSSASTSAPGSMSTSRRMSSQARNQVRTVSSCPPSPGGYRPCVLFSIYIPRNNMMPALPRLPSTDPAAYAFLVAMEPGPGSDQDFNDWFQRQHLDMLSMCNGYVRTILFKLEQEQPRTDPSKPSTVPPSYLAVHEFETLDSMDHKQFQRTQETEWAKRILDKAERVEISSYKLLSAFGYGMSD